MTESAILIEISRLGDGCLEAAKHNLYYDLTMIFDFYAFPIFKHFSVPLALVFTLLLASCGDVQGEAETLTLSIDGRGSSYLAFQDGVAQDRAVQAGIAQNGEAASGAWIPLAADADTPHKLTLTDPQGRYGVLSLCLDETTGNLSVNVQYGVVSQTPTVSAECLTTEPVATVSVSGAVLGLAGKEYGNVYMGGVSALVDSAAPRHRLELPAARYDLVASRYGGAARVPNRLLLEPGLLLTEGAEVDVDFYGPFSFRPEVAKLAISGVRTGELLSGSVELITSGGTAARVGEYTGGDVLTYARIPAGLAGQVLAQGATLRAEVQSFSYNDRTKAGSSRSISRTLPNPPGEPVSVKLPALLSPHLNSYSAGTLFSAHKRAGRRTRRAAGATRSSTHKSGTVIRSATASARVRRGSLQDPRRDT